MSLAFYDPPYPTRDFSAQARQAALSDKKRQGTACLSSCRRLAGLPGGGTIPARDFVS